LNFSAAARARRIGNEMITAGGEVAYHCAANTKAKIFRLILSSEGAMCNSVRHPVPYLLTLVALALAFLLVATPRAAGAQSQSGASEADSAAITKLCADFSENFTRHDAHGVAATFAEDADFTNMRGNHSHGRADIEKWFANLFRGNLKDSVRTDTVRSIRFFSPELAAVDLDTVITGTKAADGSEIPARKGLMVVLAVKQSGRWYIATFHESEYPVSRAETGK
jgi:uncharacterized protein (TIGR02246 family)